MRRPVSRSPWESGHTPGLAPSAPPRAAASRARPGGRPTPGSSQPGESRPRAPDPGPAWGTRSAPTRSGAVLGGRGGAACLPRKYTCLKTLPWGDSSQTSCPLSYRARPQLIAIAQAQHDVLRASRHSGSRREVPDPGPTSGSEPRPRAVRPPGEARPGPDLGQRGGRRGL